MLIDNHKTTVMTLMEEGENLIHRLGDAENETKVRTARREADAKESPTIMFYGLYNAGKSTLINALCKQDIAKVGDVPTTASIQTVPWEGYTLIDTPGIDARDEHTRIAQKEIEQSDIVLFVMDNADTFDNAAVYQAIIEILGSSKALIVILNQKNVEADDEELFISDQPAIRKVLQKITMNLEVQGQKSGIKMVCSQNNFLGVYPVNAQDAVAAAQMERDSQEVAGLLYQRCGVLSLKNSIDQTLRRSGRVHMLMTPLIALQNALRSAAAVYQNSAVYGEQQQLAEERRLLSESRQRLQESLLAKGMLKIEGAFERIRSAGANGQPTDGVSEQLKQDLQQLLEEAAAQEQAILQTEIRLSALPGALEMENSLDTSAKGGSQVLKGAGAVVAAEAIQTAIPLPIPIPEITILLVVLKGLFSLLSGKQKEEQEARERARQSQEQLAAYYKWMNELRDAETSAKASYEKAVRDFLQQHFDAKLEAISQSLSAVDADCAEHTENLRALEQLQLRVGEEIAALSISI